MNHPSNANVMVNNWFVCHGPLMLDHPLEITSKFGIQAWKWVKYICEEVHWCHGTKFASKYVIPNMTRTSHNLGLIHKLVPSNKGT